MHWTTWFLHNSYFILRLFLQKKKGLLLFFASCSNGSKEPQFCNVWSIKSRIGNIIIGSSRGCFTHGTGEMVDIRMYICPKTIPILKESFHICKSKTSVRLFVHTVSQTTCCRPKKYSKDKRFHVGETTRICRFLRQDSNAIT
jgi:hypothetical protein